MTSTTPSKKASAGEILAWAMYDVANATYGTVIATAVYNAYFVDVVAGKAGMDKSAATFLLTIVICVSSLLVVVSAPVIGTIADALAAKKKILLISTACCILGTLALAFVGPGQYIAAMIVLVIANLGFFTGEDLVAAFLPEIASRETMGRISAIGWAAGYIGGLITLGGCLSYVIWAQHNHQDATQYVPGTLLICAFVFSIASAPTFIWLKERATPDPEVESINYVVVGFHRLKKTINHARHYRDLLNFLITLFVYSCGTSTVLHLASVYAQQVMGFTTKDCIGMILVVNLTAAAGATIFGFVQDRIGSVRTLRLSLYIWAVAVFFAYSAIDKKTFWLAANMVGIAMGATGSAGRALVGQFSPQGRSGEFLGLWGVAVKLATAVGAISFGAITLATGFRNALLLTNSFFVIGIALLGFINEERGKQAAEEQV